MAERFNYKSLVRSVTYETLAMSSSDPFLNVKILEEIWKKYFETIFFSVLNVNCIFKKVCIFLFKTVTFCFRAIIFDLRIYYLFIYETLRQKFQDPPPFFLFGKNVCRNLELYVIVIDLEESKRIRNCSPSTSTFKCSAGNRTLISHLCVKRTWNCTRWPFIIRATTSCILCKTFRYCVSIVICLSFLAAISNKLNPPRRIYMWHYTDTYSLVLSFSRFFFYARYTNFAHT